MKSTYPILPTVAAAFLFCLFGLSMAMSQLPVKRGHSAAHTGMFYYDFREADDLRQRRYLYTVCPDQAGCISLDFTLVEAKGDADFIKVYEGQDDTGELIGSLGPGSGDLLLQSQGGCLTFEFVRDASSLKSVWTAYWQSDKEGDCIDPRRSPQECSYVQEICGPEYHEAFRYFGTGEIKDQLPTGCLEAEHNSVWYKFRAAKDGPLTFSILPDNQQDDLDWALWKANPESPEVCPADLGNHKSVSCNYSAGRGPLGATGMDPRGRTAEEGVAGSPFCQTIEAKKGETFFLLVDRQSDRGAGFRIVFNETVLTCKGQSREFVHFAHAPKPVENEVPANYRFTQHTRMLRLDLGTKMNESLVTCDLPPDLLTDISSAKAGQFKCEGKGLIAALLEGMRSGTVQAYSAYDLRTPVQYGDLLDLAYKLSGEQFAVSEPVDPVFGASPYDYWNPDPIIFSNFENAVELIVDEVFDRSRGVKRRQIRYVRLLWSDWEGNQPDYNVAVFRYPDILPLLEKIEVPHRLNESASLSAREMLESGQFESILLWRSGRSRGEKDNMQEVDQRQLEYDNLIWDH